MLDLETMSTFHDAAVVAVSFIVMEDEKPASRDWLAEGWLIDPSLAIGHISHEAMGFWDDQAPEVRKKMFSGKQSPREVLQEINSFLHPHVKDDNYLVYADPASFDFPILRHQFATLGIMPVWGWRRERCMGSMRKGLEEEAQWPITRVESEVPHHATYDALAQMSELLNILEAYRQIRNMSRNIV